MKKSIRILTLAILGGLVMLQACKKDKDDPQPLALSTITVGTVDLNGATAPTGVDPTLPIIATFSTAVDASTATSSNLVLTRDFDDAVVATTINTAGNVVTITPNDDLSGGALYVLSLGGGLKSTGGLALTGISRSFTTSGTFTPDDQVSHWSFNDTANDELGVNSPASLSDVVAIEYKTGRNAAAGKAAYFNGTTSIIEIPDGDQIMSDEFSIAYWMNLDSNAMNTAGAQKGHFVMGVGAFNGMQFEVSDKEASFKWAQMYRRVYTLDGENKTDTSGLDVSYSGNGIIHLNGRDTAISVNVSKDANAFKSNFGANAWNHIVYTFSASAKVTNIYWNGVLVYQMDFNFFEEASDAGNRPFYNATRMAFKNPNVAPGADDYYDKTWAFGFWESRASTFPSWNADYRYSSVDAGHYKGSLDDVRLFHRELSAQEITLLYNSEK